ncbi:Uncharacterised protein [Mycoplasmopsis synoviae]|uniref:Uncharacterized protein n=1 Tax=Mycoplasmopsis synoviae TaxID=2109 RepID=A0A3B0P8D6_MYCSY|nr:Uncharacterised protein [Mycoplasmopsis synoviae]
MALYKLLTAPITSEYVGLSPSSDSTSDDKFRDFRDSKTSENKSFPPKEIVTRLAFLSLAFKSSATLW